MGSMDILMQLLVVKHADTKLLSAVFHILFFVSACFTTRSQDKDI